MASKNNEEVVILERNDKLLKKLLITGNGRCNYFNDDFDVKHYYSDDFELLGDIINVSNRKLFMDFFNDLGIVPYIKNGYYYPYSRSSSSVKEILERKLEFNNVKVITSAFVKDISKFGDKFKVLYNDDFLVCDRVILSAGSKAYPKTGSDGNGYSLIRKFGHTINRVYPTLTKFIGNELYFKKWDGVRSEVVLSLYENDMKIKEEFGEVQFTKTGISGICVFNLSNLVSKGLLSNNKEIVKINFMPFITGNVINWFNSRNDNLKNNDISLFLEGFLNYKLIDIILNFCGIDKSSTWNKLSDNKKKELIKSLTEFEFKVCDVGTYEASQVCGGGISLKEVNLSTMESKLIDNLYLTGELLDITGDCGGYNLGLAFISGILAGRSGKDD